VIAHIAGRPADFNSLADVALKLGPDRLEELLDGTLDPVERKKQARALLDRLFATPASPSERSPATQVVRRMVETGEVPAPSDAVRRGMPAREQGEVLAETLAALWKKRRELDPSRGAFALAARVALNKSRDRLAHAAAGRTQRYPVSDPVPDRRFPGPHEVAEARELRAAIGKYICALGRIDRAILVGRYFAGLTWAEIAARVKMHKTTVFVRHRAILACARRVLGSRAP
jgi:RNA polymerase sigma factor (sigma-70 family)